MASAKRRKAWQRGWTAETICVVWLRLHGYRIIARRQRTPVGEIDIVARRRQILAIVEVKARPDRTTALESITPRQRKRLVRAAQWLIAGRPDLADLNIRFDVMAVAPRRLPAYIIDAWRPDDG
ncbi:MAG: YraN family protein [Alphaproteobacteria bacterium]|nr:YraN family protein [Alphaproteobacteria bacterium]